MPTKILPPTPSAYQYPLLIKSILMSSQRHEVTQEIVYRDQLRYDYTTFHARVCRLANLLQELGVEQGDTVAVLDWDSHRYLECYFAIPMLGAVLHHVNIRLSDEQVLYTMNHAEDKWVLVNDDFVELMERIGPSLNTVKAYVQLSDDGRAYDGRLPMAGEYEKLMAAVSDQYDFPDFDENSVATTFYTTGTTGNPKGVYFTHRQLVLHTLTLIGSSCAYKSLPLLSSDDVYMPMTPMFHVHAWGMPYVAVMLTLQQVYPGKYEPNTLVKLQQREGVTFSHCVPTILQMLFDCSEGQKADFSGLKVITGGSALSNGLAERALQHGIEIFNGYGMSETCPLTTQSHLRRAVRQLPIQEQISYRTRSILCNFVDMQILDEQDRPLPRDGNSVGEIVIRSPWLTQGYVRESEKSEALWRSGWLHTGDTGCLHPDGTLELKDRIKDVIKTGGEWISSIQLEDLISQHPLVAEVAVIGRPDEQWGERPYALVIATASESPLTAECIRSHLMQYVDSGQINKWWIPKSIELVRDFPRTSVGKTDKKAIRASIQHV